MTTACRSRRDQHRRPVSAGHSGRVAITLGLLLIGVSSNLWAQSGSSWNEAPLVANERLGLDSVQREITGRAPAAAGGARTGTSSLLEDRPIGQLRATLADPPSGRPEDIATELVPGTRLPGETDPWRNWCPSALEWEAPATRSLPLYFEEPNLERLGLYYGYPQTGWVRRTLLWPVGVPLYFVDEDTWIKQQYRLAQCEDCLPGDHQLLQPFVSAANFFGRVPALPYMMGVDCPYEAQYDLGADRPGTPTPYRRQSFPLSLRGALYQAAASTGVAFLIP